MNPRKFLGKSNHVWWYATTNTPKEPVLPTPKKGLPSCLTNLLRPNAQRLPGVTDDD